MIQKLINVLAVASFVGVAGIIGAGYCVYQNKDALIQELIPLPDLDLPAPGLGGDAPDVAPLPVVPAIPGI